LLGHIRSKQLNVQRHRVRDSIHRVDPINTALRWHDKLHRKPYSVSSSNSLWHIEANLKLVRWGFVIQAGIDGYSRIIVYAKCSLDNKAETTLTLFTAAERVYGKPSRVRCDYGKENIRVAEHMLRTRGLNRGSIITGPSNRNQRIERVWRDCRRSAITFFSRLFRHMEEREQCLELDNPVHMFSLQYVYQARIQTMLDQWVASWNSHPVAGCGNLSPLQMREAGFLQRFGHTSITGTAHDVFDPILPEETSEENYGVDWTQDAPSDDESQSHQPPATDVPSYSLPGRVSPEQAIAALQKINPNDNDNNSGITLYKRCVKLLQRL